MNWMRFFQYIKGLSSQAKETLFPRSCALCQSAGSFLCESCFPVLQNSIRHSQSCGSCGARETPQGVLCSNCAGTVPHDGIFAAFRYHDPRIARLIHSFKYRFIHELGDPLGRLLASALSHSDLPLPDAIFPVPLHPRRERWRGWNQAEILANTIARSLPEDLSPPVLRGILVRTRFTVPQMSIRDKDLRKKNIEGAFQILPEKKAEFLSKFSQKTEKYSDKDSPFEISGKNIWLVDDVAASGSTLAAASAALKDHGAKEVFGIVIAR